MGVPFVQVDAFTAEPFAGNPAAVCVLDAPRDAAWMQAVAEEMNLSETAFLRARDDGGWTLRWFTPTVEVDLCGHATLASAHALWEEGVVVAGEPIAFHTRSGELGASRDGDWILLDFPSQSVEPLDDPPPEVVDGLGASPRFVGRALAGFLVEVGGEDLVRDLVPDFAVLGRLPTSVMVTARSSSDGYDFVSRFFAPTFGIDEDPVTGSAHCALGPFWAERLGRIDLVGFQASARGGIVRLSLRGDRVALGGKAVTIARGELVSG